MKTVRIKFKELSASEITALAIKILTLQGARVRRVNNVGAYKKRARQVQNGWPDIQGYDKEGKVMLCEVKKIGDYLSEDQVKRLKDCQECGGVSMIATQDKLTGKFELRDFVSF